MEIKGDIKFETVTYESSLFNKIMKAANEIEKANRKGKANLVIFTSVTTADEIEKSIYDGIRQY